MISVLLNFVTVGGQSNIMKCDPAWLAASVAPVRELSQSQVDFGLRNKRERESCARDLLLLRC